MQTSVEERNTVTVQLMVLGGPDHGPQALTE